MGNKHQFHQSIQDFRVRHILDVDRLALGILAEPWLLEISIEAFDDIGFLVLQDRW
jgi:hypothetical protein